MTRKECVPKPHILHHNIHRDGDNYVAGTNKQKNETYSDNKEKEMISTGID